jgi:hypothetical protein
LLLACVLHLVTVEFDADEEAKGFPLPDWFGSTADRRFTRQSIALRRLNEAPEIPLSDAALNSPEGRFPAQTRMAINQPRAKQIATTRAQAQSSRETVMEPRPDRAGNGGDEEDAA